MKIGDVEVTKISRGQSVECHNGCDANATYYRDGVPYCADCLQKKWDDDGNFFTNSEGKRIYFDVIREFLVDEK